MQNTRYTWLGRLVLFGYLAGLLHPFFPYWEYALNQQYIARTLCENKDRPELNCAGKCYLAQRLVQMGEQADGQQGAVPVKLHHTKDVLHLCTAFQARLPQPEITGLLAGNDGVSTFPHFRVEIFHPPRHRDILL